MLKVVLNIIYSISNDQREFYHLIVECCFQITISSYSIIKIFSSATADDFYTVFIDNK